MGNEDPVGTTDAYTYNPYLTDIRYPTYKILLQDYPVPLFSVILI